MLASAVPPIMWLSQAKPPQRWQVEKELPVPPETVDPPLYKISFRCWNWAPGLLWKTMNISLLEAKDCVISASNSCFLRGLGGCGALSSPLEHWESCLESALRGTPCCVVLRGGWGVERGCGSVLASLNYSTTEYEKHPQKARHVDYYNMHNPLPTVPGPRRGRMTGPPDAVLWPWLPAAFISSLRSELEKRAKSESGHLLVPVSVSVGRGQRSLGLRSLFFEYNLFFLDD